MGYRGHTIKQHREYGEAAFQDYDDFVGNILPAFREAVPNRQLGINEAQDYYETSREDVMAFIDSIKLSDGYYISSTMTNSELKSALLTTLDEVPEGENVIAWEWY